MAFHRRDLIHGAITAGAASVVAASPEENTGTISMPNKVVDTNVSLFQWPFRRLPLDEVDELCLKLGQLGITEAWASSFEGLLHRDIRSANERLLNTCQTRAELVPVGAINPTLPDWKHDLHLCLGRSAMPGIRLFPGYHGYDLRDEVFGELLATATKLRGFVQIAFAMEDTRTQSHHMVAANVDPRPLEHWMQKFPEARVQILNCRPSTSDKQIFSSIPRVVVDSSRVDGTDGVTTLASAIGIDRVLFGSHAPFLIPEAACIRMLESGVSAADIKELMSTNADNFRKATTTTTTNHRR